MSDQFSLMLNQNGNLVQPFQEEIFIYNPRVLFERVQILVVERCSSNTLGIREHVKTRNLLLLQQKVS